MFIRFKLIAVFSTLTFTIVCANDESIAQWIQQTYKQNKNTESTTNKKLDLSPTVDAEDISESRLTKDGKRCECVAYYLCDSDTNTIIDDGTTIIDVRERECSSYLEICCVLKKDNVSKNGPPVTVAAEAQNEKIPAGDEIFKPSNDIFDSQCGWNDHSNFVFPKKDNLYYANYGEFPWMVALMRRANTTAWSNNNYLGGGTIIHPSVVVTAAHKLRRLQADNIKCRAGEWDMQTPKERFQFQERNVKKFKLHNRYFNISLYNDVALLFLEAPFDLVNSPIIAPACLGRSLPPPGTVCYSMGWGSNLTNNFVYANILKKIKLPLVEAKKCQRQLQKTRLGSFFRLHSSLTCAGGEVDVDTCQGDGGSALVCPVEKRENHTRYMVYGIVAYGIDCGEPDRPGVYVNIPNVTDWIDREMIKTKYGTVTYTDNIL